MKYASFHIHGDLNDLLPPERRDAEFRYEFEGKPSVKDAVEAIGIPHVEVDVISINGRSVPFTAHLRDGDRVVAFPPGVDSKIADVMHLWPEPPPEPRFILDVHLGKLAKYLRLLGCDVWHDNRLDDPEIASIAAEQDRIALTRDVALLKNGAITCGYWIRSQNPPEQLREVIRRYRLTAKARPFTRCIVCNGIIEETAKELVRERLQPKTREYYDCFYRCVSCGRIYWEGSHYHRMRNLVEEAMGEKAEFRIQNPEFRINDISRKVRKVRNEKMHFYPVHPIIIRIPVQTKGGSMVIIRKPYGTAPDGTMADIFTLVNRNGLEARITNYGGIVTALITPDRNGSWGDIVLGYDTLGEYVRNNPYFGCIVGRYANRIAGGRFTLDGVEYILAKNNGENHLHGGLKGFDKAVWNAETFMNSSGPSLKLTHRSANGEEGYPGNLDVMVTYSLTNDDELRIDYEAAADRATVLNLTNHSYFNLAGEEAGSILGHELTINADAFTPIDGTLIPTGELRRVAGTPLDFTRPRVIGEQIDGDYDQLVFGLGYDHNWVLNLSEEPLTFAARVYEPGSGRALEVLTTEPGIQFYTGNFLDGSCVGKKGKVYNRRYGFCLETQHFPDSPNKPQFPSTVLRPGERYTQTTVYRFSVI